MNPQRWQLDPDVHEWRKRYDGATGIVYPLHGAYVWRLLTIEETVSGLVMSAKEGKRAVDEAYTRSKTPEPVR
jgi:hypothetical protein